MVRCKHLTGWPVQVCGTNRNRPEIVLILKPIFGSFPSSYEVYWGSGMRYSTVETIRLIHQEWVIYETKGITTKADLL